MSLHDVILWYNIIFLFEQGTISYLSCWKDLNTTSLSMHNMHGQKVSKKWLGNYIH
jgi:hypothetical protein